MLFYVHLYTSPGPTAVCLSPSMYSISYSLLQWYLPQIQRLDWPYTHECWIFSSVLQQKLQS